MEALSHDVRCAIRTFRTSPGFAAVAILTLALGIGATTAIFSVVNAVLLRPLPYPDSDRLVRVVERPRSADASSAGGGRAVGVTLSDLAAFRTRSRSLSHIGVYAGATMMLTGQAEAAVRLETTRLSPAVLAMLRTPAQVGRLFEEAEEAAGAPPVVVLSHGLWQRRFGGMADMLGQTLTLDGRQYSVIGVMPRGFQFPDAQTELWIPYTLGGPMLRARVAPIARLADGVSLEAASAEVSSILPGLATTLQANPDGPPRIELATVHDQLVERIRPALVILAAAVGLVLLIACANVANLVMARTAARQREIAIRSALGAGRLRIVRQLLAESLLLALVGGIAGVVCAFGGIRVLKTLGMALPRRDMVLDAGIPRLDEIGIDLSALAFTLVVATLAGVLSGVAAAVRQLQSPAPNALRETGGSSDVGFNVFGRHRAQGLLVVAEIAMAMVLLVAGGLLIHSFVKLSNVDPGYDTAGVLTFRVFSEEQGPASFPEQLIARIRSLPGVRDAGYAEMLPTVRFRSGVGLRTTSAPPTTPAPPPAPGAQLPPQSPDARIVSRDFLSAMGIEIVEGRGFGDDDRAGRPKVLLINQTLARSGYLGPIPVGTHVYAAGPAPWQVIGIVEDVRQYGLDQRPDPQIFVDVRQLPSGNPNVYYAVRGTDTSALVSNIRGIVAQLDPRALVDDVATMQQLASNTIARQRLYAALLGIFALLAAALAAIGIYGVMAYAVTLRTREIGIRMALGATRPEVLGLVLRQSLLLTCGGVIIGIGGAIGVTRYLDAMLYGVAPLDPMMFTGAAVMFTSVATLAALVPARRAIAVDPLVALRRE